MPAARANTDRVLPAAPIASSARTKSSRSQGIARTAGTRNLFHGVDQHRQPRAFAVAGSPRFGLVRPDLMTHRLVSCPSALPRSIPAPAICSRRPYPQRKSVGCDLLHKGTGPPALNLRNDPEITPTVARSAPRHRYRLHLDRHRRRGRLDCADLSPADLIRPEIAARAARCPLRVCVPLPPKGSHRTTTFAP